MAFLTIITRLIIVFILSGLFGLNRQRAHKPVGFGTFIFVAIGSCALAITSLDLSGQNPLPLLSAIVTGIGFLGAGAMIKTTDKIFGVTTAASIWLFAIFGLLIGVGEYLTGTLLYLLVWVVILIDSHLERRGIGSYQRKAIITTDLSVTDKHMRTLLSLASQRYKLLETIIDRKEGNITRHYIIEGSHDSITRLPL